MNVDQYREIVRSVVRTRDGQPIYNASVEHASVVIENLFASARRRIDVLSGSFNPRVYGRDAVIEEAKLFLASSQENQLRIILENDSEPDRLFHPFFRACSHFPNLEVRVAPLDVQDRYQFHCVLVDDDSYRFASDKRRPSAVAAFGDRTGAEILEKAYSFIWASSKSIGMPAQT